MHLTHFFLLCLFPPIFRFLALGLPPPLLLFPLPFLQTLTKETARVQGAFSPLRCTENVFSGAFVPPRHILTVYCRLQKMKGDRGTSAFSPVSEKHASHLRRRAGPQRAASLQINGRRQQQRMSIEQTKEDCSFFQSLSPGALGHQQIRMGYEGEKANRTKRKKKKVAKR